MVVPAKLSREKQVTAAAMMASRFVGVGAAVADETGVGTEAVMAADDAAVDCRASSDRLVGRKPGRKIAPEAESGRAKGYRPRYDGKIQGTRNGNLGGCGRVG